jgi:hypothetical protein
VETQAPTQIPSLKAVRDLLADLLGRDVTVEPGAPLDGAQRAGAAHAVYVNQRLEVAAVLEVDVTLSACLGAAIGLIPAPRAQDAAKEGRLEGDLRDNLYEVCNIVSALFNLPDAPHLKLYEMYAPGEHPPANISALAATPGAREDIAVGVNGYGAGTMSVVLAPL